MNSISYAKLEQYRSPRNERSLYKGIPIKYLEAVQNVAVFQGKRIKVRYRGPRKGNGGTQSTCLKAYATTFAVYVRP